MPKRLTGFYDRRGYWIEDETGKVLYEAGNNPLESSGVIENGLPLSTIRGYCETTGKDMAIEEKAEWMCAQETEKVVVIFRVWKKGGDVIALFPGIKETKNFCGSYEHVGQHGGADYQGVINQTTPARPEDYYDLMKELEGIGYNLKIQKRFTR